MVFIWSRVVPRCGVAHATFRGYARSSRRAVRSSEPARTLRCRGVNVMTRRETAPNSFLARSLSFSSHLHCLCLQLSLALRALRERASVAEAG